MLAQPSVRRVAVSGGIAVGKTTLARQLCDLIPNSQVLLEYPEQNRFLADFYADMRRWAFHSRVAMLALFAQRDADADRTPSNCGLRIMDRCLAEAVVFARLQHAAGNMTEREYETYLSLRGALLTYSPPPDVIVYLHCDAKTALTRLQSRGRPFELQVTTDYLNRVSSAYEGWLAELPTDCRIIRCDTAAPISLQQLASQIVTT